MSTTAVADPAKAIDITEQEVRFYENEGYIVLPCLLDVITAGRIRDEVLDLAAGEGVSRESLSKATSSGDKLRQFGKLYEGSLIEAMVFSSNILAIAAKIMRGPSTTYLPFTAVKSGGGGGSFHFHQDNQYTRHEGPSCNIWIALQEMSPQNGCLCVVPRSNHAGTLDSRLSGDGDGHRRTLEDPTDFLSVRMNPGDAIAFTRLTVHGSGPNNTSEPRVAYALQYHRDDTKYLDPADNSWKSLKDSPRWKLDRVKRQA
jgi:phytanoyl-CoA hydroxylase